MTDPLDMSDELETRRRRACYRAEHRGTKELDLILGPFARAHVGLFDAEQMDLFELVLDAEETDLQSILMGLTPVPAGPASAMLNDIRTFQIRRASAGAGSV